MPAEPVPPTAAEAAARPGAAAPGVTPAALAKAALRRLAQQRLEPTPEHYATAYAREAADAGVDPAGPDATGADAGRRRVLERLVDRAGVPDADARRRLCEALVAGRSAEAARLIDALSDGADDGFALAELIGRLTGALDVGGRQWTRARRRESLQRVLDGSRSDAGRLRARLTQLVASWQDDTADAPIAALDAPLPPTPVSPSATSAPPTGEWTRATDALGAALCAALAPRHDAGQDAAASVSARLAAQLRRLHDAPPTVDAAAELALTCDEADRLLQHRAHLLDQLARLCRELTDGLVDLAEDGSWARGQCEAMRDALDAGLSARGVGSVGELLRVTRARQAGLRAERDHARDALKDLIQRLLGDLGELGVHTGRFRDRMDRHATAVEQADTLEGLAGVVRRMVEDSRAVAGLVGSAGERLDQDRRRAQALDERVAELEADLRRLSEEVSTDQLTEVANRRGLIARFEHEQAAHADTGAPLSIGLLDVDNFKRLNDELGHAAGDVALRSLAQAVQRRLSPDDLIARFGGEEFVVLMPRTAATEARERLVRLQRALSGSLFMHEARPVFVTFSAGVTAWRSGESLDAVLERADGALYEAKRSGKNRSCLA